MSERLDRPGTIAGAFVLHRLGEVTSTMVAIKSLPQPNHPQDILVLRADRQTAARGRAGHSWQSLDGNLFCTIAWPVQDVPLSNRAEISFCVALALRSAMMNLGVAAGSISLKWPNDVMVEGQKIAGLLLEADRETVLIGVGANIVAAPVDTGQAVTKLIDHVSKDRCVSAGQVQHAFLTALDEQIAVWRHQGFETVRQQWLAAAHRLGGDIRARFGSAAAPQVLTGRFDGIDEAGRLILRTTDGQRHKISAASVHEL